jgi:large subunit ribosomal protein L15
MNLSQLQKIKKKGKDVGRGGQRGGTSGRGNKGQRARSGGMVSRKQFEGGQTPLTRRLPKRGFNNSLFNEKINIVSLESIVLISEKKSIYNIDKLFLFENNLIKNLKLKVKILLKKPDCSLSVPLTLSVDKCSQSVIKKVLAAGGMVLDIK